MARHQQTRITIPAGLTFSALQLSRDPATSDVDFDWQPIDQICAASGLDVGVFRDHDEGRLGQLIMHWYALHRRDGGALDPVAEDLILEALMEDRHGGGLSHQPGRA